LLNALAKHIRGRGSFDELNTELADVSIMVEQIARFYGWEEFLEERVRKIERLKNRLESKG
jgi:NTP pyrophosphatase (non-canonical NTP hydrolase)